MRLRFAVLASAVVALATMIGPGVVHAAPRHNHHLRINATPNPVLAGESVLIYGQLQGSDIAGKPIVLYHHISGSRSGYVPIGHTTTDAHGFYEFTRAEGVVETNRSWFVTQPGTVGVHSRTVYERVTALVSVSATPTATDARHPVVFSGHVEPNHAFERVYLQEQKGESDDWTTLNSARLGPASNYSLAYRWVRPGVHDVRVVFGGDGRNLRGVSDTVTVTIGRAQVSDFTIASSAPVIDYGDSVTVWGKLFTPGTSTPAPPTPVTVWARTGTQTGFAPVANTTTGSDGSYAFAGQKPAHNTVYVVRSTLSPSRHSAQLFEGVADVVTLGASSSTAIVGGRVTFGGTVLPDKSGHVVYLQRLGTDGDWHTVEVGRVHSGSTFQFGWVFGTPGIKQFRARVPGGPSNVGGHSAPVTISVSLPPVSSLPPRP